MTHNPELTEKIIYSLRKYYGQVDTPLHSHTNEQLAIAVVLSAQTTDNQVNKVTPELFRKYPDMPTLARGNLRDIEKIIFSTGFYKAKAKNIKNLAIEVTEKFKGSIPEDFDALLKLPGIGRKTANVIMDCAFNKSCGFVVDTHVKRLAHRLGWTEETNPEKIEKDLMKVIPKKDWRDLSLYLIYHGRKYCIARNPICSDCFLNQLCPTAFQWGMKK